MKLAKYNLRNFLHVRLYFVSLYDAGERTYEAIQGIFVIPSFFRRVRAILLHSDIDDVCWVTGSAANPPRRRGDCDQFKEGGFFVVVCELGLHFFVNAKASSRICCCMPTVLTKSSVCGIGGGGFDLVVTGLPRAVEMC